VWRPAMKVLNLYAGIGGNRKLWQDIDITAVEFNPDIASIYQDFFPNDKVIVTDAHEYLLNHFAKYDFIWSSPPCQTHSQIRYNIGFKANRKYRKVNPVYPDMALYQEIILLQKYYNGLWVVENTIPYYEPLIPGVKTGGHIWWSNFKITKIDHGNRNHRDGTVESLQERKLLDLSKHNIPNKRQILRNCVEPEVGRHVFDCALNSYAKPEMLELEFDNSLTPYI
jgi:DNA (cytosine-5)-methyltransferase 1